MRRRGDVPVATAAGAATSLAFPTTGWWPLALIGVAVLLGILRGRSRGRSALIAAFWGLGFIGTLIGWLAEVDLLGWALLVVAQMVWLALFGAIVGSTGWGRSPTPPIRTAIAVGVLWTGIEILRARYPLGGFAWGLLGNPFVDVPGIRDLAAVGGVHAVGAWVAIAAALFVRSGESGAGRGRRELVAPLVLAILALLAPLAPRPATTGSLDVALIQGNVPKERFASAAGRRGRVGPEDIVVVENHLRATEPLLTEDDRPDLVVWPENAFDRDPDQYLDLATRTQTLIDELDVPFIVGAIVDDDDGRSYNANLLWEPRGDDHDPLPNVTARYEKRHLVPFGEYVPWGWPRRVVRALAEQVPSDLTPGESSSVLPAAGVQIGNVICFESTDPRDVRRAIDHGAQVVLVSTNDATFGDSAAAPQHLQASRMRAIEHRIPILHAAISGISGVIDADGAVSHPTELFTEAVVRAQVATISGRTIYGTIGGALEAGAIGFALLGLLGAFLPGRYRTNPIQGTRPRIGRIVVAIPTYDEAGTIRSTVQAVREQLPRAEIWILDDDSPDGTGAIADELAAADPAITVIHRAEKRGLGQAYLDAFRRALADPNVDAVIEFDADGSHPADRLPALLGAAENADLVIGSRYLPGGSVHGWDRRRELLSRAGNLYARTLLGLPVKDLTAGFRLYRRAVLERIPLDRVGSEGYAFQIEMTLRAARLGATIVEVPIAFRDRETGTSKMSRRIVLEALWRVPALALRRGGRRIRPYARRDG